MYIEGWEPKSNQRCVGDGKNVSIIIGCRFVRKERFISWYIAKCVCRMLYSGVHRIPRTFPLYHKRGCEGYMLDGMEYI